MDGVTMDKWYFLSIISNENPLFGHPASWKLYIAGLVCQNKSIFGVKTPNCLFIFFYFEVEGPSSVSLLDRFCQKKLSKYVIFIKIDSLMVGTASFRKLRMYFQHVTE